MKKLRIYLDTSVISFLFAEDAPEFQKITIDFFENYLSRFVVYISEVVIFELSKTNDLHERNNLLNVIKDYPLIISGQTDQDEISRLADLYVSQKIILVKKREDALHLAISTILECDILLSWNFKHLANINKQVLINSINEKEGYLKRLNLLSPLEVVYDEE